MRSHVYVFTVFQAVYRMYLVYVCLWDVVYLSFSYVLSMC